MSEATLFIINIESLVYQKNKECIYFNRNEWITRASFFLKRSLTFIFELSLLPRLLSRRNRDTILQPISNRFKNLLSLIIHCRSRNPIRLCRILYRVLERG